MSYIVRREIFVKNIALDFLIIVLINFILCSCASHVSEQNQSDHHPSVNSRSIIKADGSNSPLTKQLGDFMQWFFGVPEPELSSNSTTPRTGGHNHTISQHPHSSKVSHQTILPRNITELSVADVSFHQVNSPITETQQFNQTKPQRRIIGLPRSRNSRSNILMGRSNSSKPKQIEITDIQTAIGTEIDAHDHNEDPSQINLQEELATIDEFERKVSQNYDYAQPRSQPNTQIDLNYAQSQGQISVENSEKRLKRQLSNSEKQYMDLNIPNPHNRKQSRQGILMSPLQQMYVLRQQQAQAAALLQQQALQQQQQQSLVGMGGKRPYFYDDYDDDDSDYDDDSDSLEDDESMGFYNPVKAGMNNNGNFRPPLGHHMMGIGRRSAEHTVAPVGLGSKLSDSHIFNPLISNNRQLKNKNSKNNRKSPGPNRRFGAGPITKDGDWTLIDDYDLSSDFHKARDSLPFEDRLQWGLQRSGMPTVTKGPCPGGRCGKQDTMTSSTEGSTTNAAGASTAATSSGSESTSAAKPSGGPSTTGAPSSTAAVGGVLSSLQPTTATLATMSPAALSSSSAPISSSASTVTGSSTAAVTVAASSTTHKSTTKATTSSESSSHTTPEGDSDSSTSTTKAPEDAPPHKASLNCRCGAQSIRGEMVTRGAVVRVPTNPWLVAISNKNHHMCSGSIINNKYILTSAQCVQGVVKNQLVVTAGLATRSAKNFTVNKIVAHPSYSERHSAHNLALLRLSSPISVNQMMRPVCLPISQHSRGKFATANLATWYQKSSQLQMIQTDVRILGDKKCNSSIDHYGEGKLCTSPPGKTDCGGDTGGVLQVSGNDFTHEQIGVVGETVGCRNSDTVGVHADLRNYTRWILTETKDARYCNRPKVKPSDLDSLTDIDARYDLDYYDEEDF